MVAQLELTPRRIKIKRIPTDPTRMRQLLGYIGYGRFDSFSVGDTIAEKLKVKPTAALTVSYREDPFDPTNNELFTKYGFVDFTGIDNLENIGLEERRALLRGEEVSIVISTTETWSLTLHERNTNLLQDSNRSETAYYFPWQHVLNPRSNIYNTDFREIPDPFINPFCGGDHDESVGYRDAYSTWRFVEN